MIPEDKLVERNTNVLRISAALSRSGEWEALHHFGELLTEQHPSLRKSFILITKNLDDLKLQGLCDEMDTTLKKELEKE